MAPLVVLLKVQNQCVFTGYEAAALPVRQTPSW